MISCVLEVVATIEENRLFDEYCDSLPETEAKKIKADRARVKSLELEHQRRIEIVKQSRSLNFWGFR